MEVTPYVERGHLGGYRAGGDPATRFDVLWTWLIHEHGVRSVIDVGCGEGQAVDSFAREIGFVERRGFGVRVVGVEGVPQNHALIVEHDYVEGPFVPAEPVFDLCWCCEFVEHVEEQYVPNFLATFQHADLLMMTHAEPGQEGYHHVNCRSQDYWIGRVGEVGFDLDPKLTAVTRALARANPHPSNHFSRSGLAFRRSDP